MFLLLGICPRQMVVGQEQDVPQLAVAWGCGQRATIPTVLEDSVSQEEFRISLEPFGWKMSDRGYMAWAHRSLFMIHVAFEAELELVIRFVVEKRLWMTKGAFSEEQKSHKYLLKPGTGVLYVEKLDGLIAFRVSNILLQILVLL